MRRWWPLSLAAFFLLCAAWAVALPANGSYDEKDHIVRAYAVADGQVSADHTVVDRRGDTKYAFDVPASLLPPNANVDCAWSPRPARTAACQRWSGSDATVAMPSGAAQYSPVYYLPVGLPLLIAPDLGGIVAARLVSALICALLLAGAVAAAQWLGSRLLVLGVMLAATPTAVGLAGAVNPNGPEIAAGILVFCAGLALARAPEERLAGPGVRRMLILAGVGSLVLLTVRQIGPALLGLDVLACALVARPGRLRALWHRRDARWLLGVGWGLGLAFAIGWPLASGLADLAPNARDAVHLGFWAQVRQILTSRVPLEARQFVGMFGYGEVSAPRYAVPAWYLLAAALAVPGAWLGGWRLRWVPVALAVLGFGLLAALDFYMAPRVGWFSQGRYALAGVVGVVLVPASGEGFARWLSGRGWLRRYLAGAACLAALLHLYMLARVMTRFQSGRTARLNPLAGDWHPALGSVTPLVAAVLGGALLVVAVLATGTTATPTAATDDRPRAPRPALAR